LLLLSLHLGGARAARRFTFLVLEFEGVNQFKEGRSFTSCGFSSLNHGSLDVGMRTSATRPISMFVVFLGLLVSACRLFAHEFTLGARA